MMQEIAVDRICPSPHNPRRELKLDDPSIIDLASSLKVHGQIPEPKTLTKLKAELKGGAK